MTGVRAVYVVLSHRDWSQVRRLAMAILRSSPESRIVIAHDARTEAFPVEPEDDRIHIIEHGLACDWGSWELVEAALIAFDFAQKRFDPELVCLISGQDYPVRPLREWEDEAIAASSWIGDAHPLIYTPHWGRRRGEGDDRWTRYAYRWFRSPAQRLGLRMPRRVDRLWRRLRAAVVLRCEPIVGVRIVSRGRGVFYGIRRVPRVFTDERPCWFGAQWLAVRRDELGLLLSAFAPGSRLRHLYRGSIIPDESAFVTPLGWRSPPGELPPVTDVRWDDAKDAPEVRTLADLADITASGSPFCRKIEPQRSAALLDELDRLITVDPG